MRKILSFVMPVVALVALTACDPEVMMVYNGCGGSWVRAWDGNGEIMVYSLPYGLEAPVEVEGSNGDRVEFLAVGYDISSGRPLGSTTTSRTIRGGSSSMHSSQLQAWRILSLQASGPEVGCQR